MRQKNLCRMSNIGFHIKPISFFIICNNLMNIYDDLYHKYLQIKSNVAIADVNNDYK